MPHPDIHVAIRLLQRGAYADASDLLEGMVTAMPTYAAAHALLARAYMLQGEHRHALGLWRRGLLLMPNSASMQRGLQQTSQVLTERNANRLLEAPKPAQATPPPSVPDEAEVAEAAAPEAEAIPVQADVPEPVAAGTVQAPLEVHVDGRTGPPAEVLEAAARDQEALETGIELDDGPAGSDGGSADFDDLDHLIQALEGARIQPKPNFERVPPPELESDIDDLVSETLARIYAAQEQFGEAAKVYDKLAEQQPERADEFMNKAFEMRARLAS